MTAAAAGRRAIVSVRDSGIGIAASHLASVFDMFTQVDRFDRHAQGGLGIGLTLVRTLVEMHGGRVEARSAGIGKGSEFLVELPMLSASVSAQLPPMSLRPFPDRRILVVDDNRDAAETLGALLKALGATVSVVHSGRAALESLDRFEPDALLLDIGMPEMDGYEVARQGTGHAEPRRHAVDCSHRMGPGPRLSAVTGRGLRPSSGQAGRHQQAARDPDGGLVR